MIFTSHFRIFSIISDFSKFHEEVSYLKYVLKKYSFPTNLVDKCIKVFLNKQFSQKILEHTFPKKELFIVLPYLGMSSLCLRTHLQKSINSNMSFSGSKARYLCVYARTLFISLRVVDLMLPITVKRAVIS